MDDTIIPNPIAAARDRLRTHIERLNKAADSGEGTKGTMKEGAILQAVATEDAAVILADATRMLRLDLLDIAQALNKRLDTLSTHIDTFTTKADQGTNRLATWTMVLAVVTGLLVLAAFAQSWATWSAAPQVIVMPIPRL